MKKRYSIFPIEDNHIWEEYNKGRTAQDWRAEKIDLSTDRYDLLNEQEQFMVDNIIAFFSNADGLINDNIADLLKQDFSSCNEIVFWYNLQTIQEQEHNILYSLFIQTYIQDIQKRDDLFNALETNSIVINKCKWFDKWVNNGTKAHKLIGLALSEGLLFSSLFASVFYFRSDSRLKGFIEGNDYVSKDEASHYRMSVYIYDNYLTDDEKLSKEEIQSIILDCYELEKEYVLQVIPDKLIGLNKNNMLQYVQYITDTILSDFGVQPVFNVTQPLAYMQQLALEGKNNFFERKSASYTKYSSLNNEDITYNEDF